MNPADVFAQVRNRQAHYRKVPPNIPVEKDVTPPQAIQPPAPPKEQPINADLLEMLSSFNDTASGAHCVMMNSTNGHTVSCGIEDAIYQVVAEDSGMSEPQIRKRLSEGTPTLIGKYLVVQR